MLKRVKGVFAIWARRALGIDEIGHQVSRLEHATDLLSGSTERLTQQVNDPRTYAIPANLHQRLSAIEASIRLLEARIALVEGLPVSVDGDRVATLGEHAKSLADAAAAKTLERRAISAVEARGMTLDQYLDMRRKRGGGDYHSDH